MFMLLAMTTSNGLGLGWVLIAAISFWRAFQGLCGTTLIAAWAWAVVAWTAIVCVTAAQIFSDPSQGNWETLRYVACVGMFCPMMAVFGAKRPQHGAWQWIVLALWCILALPAGEALLYGHSLKIGAVRGWFLVVLMAMGLPNYLPTRYWLAAIFFCVSQAIFLGPYLPMNIWASTDSGMLAGLSAGAISLVAGWASSGLPRWTFPTPIQRLWLYFRDLYGAVWAVRVAQRFNATAEQSSWPVRLHWTGFRSQDAAGTAFGELLADLPPEAGREFRSLLRRFVSPEWIAARLKQPAS